VNIPDEHLPRIIAALEFHAAYLRATKRDESRLKETVELLKRKGPKREESQPVPKRKRA
jgi:hypothetical protein